MAAIFPDYVRVSNSFFLFVPSIFARSHNKHWWCVRRSFNRFKGQVAPAAGGSASRRHPAAERTNKTPRCGSTNQIRGWRWMCPSIQTNQWAETQQAHTHITHGFTLIHLVHMISRSAHTMWPPRRHPAGFWESCLEGKCPPDRKLKSQSVSWWRREDEERRRWGEEQRTQEERKQGLRREHKEIKQSRNRAARKQGQKGQRTQGDKDRGHERKNPDGWLVLHVWCKSADADSQSCFS